MNEPMLYTFARWLCKALGHFTTGGWVNYGMFHQECRICGKIISESIQETEMEKEPMFTDREWAEAIMFGQYEQRENREEVVVFRRIDLASYVSMIRTYDAELVAEAEREACAKVCDDIRRMGGYSAETPDLERGTGHCAAAIRALKEQV